MAISFGVLSQLGIVFLIGFLIPENAIACPKDSVGTYKLVNAFLEKARTTSVDGTPAGLARAAFLASYNARQLSGASVDPNLRNAEYYLMAVSAVLDKDYAYSATLLGTPLYEAQKAVARFADKHILPNDFQKQLRSNPNNPVSEGWGFKWAYAGLVAGWELSRVASSGLDRSFDFKTPCLKVRSGPQGGGDEPGLDRDGLTRRSNRQWWEDLDPNLLGDPPQGYVNILDLPSQLRGKGFYCPIFGCNPIPTSEN